MAAYVIVDITVTDPVRYEEVKQRTPAVVAQYGGKYLSRGGQTEGLHGGWQPSRLVLLEFESLEKARQWESSPEYTAIKQLRDRCAVVNMILVQGD